MNNRVSSASWVHQTTFVLLVVFQALFVLSSGWGAAWEIGLACLAIDGLLVFVTQKALRLSKAAQKAQFQRVDEALHAVLDLTRSQQNQWRSTLRGLKDIEPEDLAAVDGIQQLITAEGTEKGRPVESMIDSVQTMILLNHSLANDLDTVFEFYHQTYGHLRKLQAEYRLNHFRVSKTVSFVEDMGRQTNRYSEKLILEILDSFRETASFSDGISNDVLGRIHSLMDSSNPESLEAIGRGSAAIKNTMDNFFIDLGKTNAYSEKAIAENLAQMTRVQEMAVVLGEFSENIRMISLNLNIEAARGNSQAGGTASGKSFQVLAAKLSEFAVKARELTEQQHATIETASSVMAKTGRAQMAQLGVLMEEIPKIKNQLDPFNTIIRQSYVHFENVVTTMERLSSSINERLKAMIGKFQYQDLVRQEQEHTLQMFKNLGRYAEQISDRGAQLDDGIKAKALDELFTAFEAIASTENEHALLRQYRNKPSDPPEEKKDSAVTAGSVSLF